MTWVGLLLIGVALSDLFRSVRRVPVLPAATGAAVVVLLGLLCGLTSTRQVIVLAVLAMVVIAWALSSEAASGAGPRPAWPPLVVLGGALLVCVVLGQYAEPVGGSFARWLHAGDIPVLSGRDPTHALVVLGAVLVQLSTGNTIVRLVLAVTGTVRPGGPGQADSELKGGRLLGPMERIFIVGLGMAGHVTAASIVIAAKGLIRWPELQSKRQAHSTGSGPDIDEVTEYFLVGSFVSWLVALGALVLVLT